jgi:hypothetical protein
MRAVSPGSRGWGCRGQSVQARSTGNLSESGNVCNLSPCINRYSGGALCLFRLSRGAAYQSWPGQRSQVSSTGPNWHRMRLLVQVLSVYVQTCMLLYHIPMAWNGKELAHFVMLTSLA